MLWNTVVCFVSSYNPHCVTIGQNSRSRGEHKRKKTAAAIGALLVRTAGEAGFAQMQISSFSELFLKFFA